MGITEKNIVICGHGSGTPSTKNMYDYLESRYRSIASNGKHKGVVKVMRLKALTNSGRKKFHDTYKTILGRNSYNQSLRSYVYTPYNGKYYSDCSSSGCATFAKIGYNVPLLNTAGIYQSNLFKEVSVNITNGHITNPEILKVGDAILFVGSDPSRPLQIGHVEFVYEINGEVPSSNPEPSSNTSTQSNKVESAKSYNKSFTGKYKVVANGGLNLRSGAGTNKSKITTIPNGKNVTCYGYYTTVNGGKWYLVVYGNYTGYVMSSYLQRV